MKHPAISLIIFLCLTRLSGAQEISDPPKPSLPSAAREQVGKTLRYDPAYQVLAYPMGDVEIEAGVCTDVVIRACRTALGLDLQKAVHEDMKRHFSRYPQRWGLKRPDKNIDHRRVPNLQTFFKRKGWDLPVTKDPSAYLPGDLVTCIVPPNLPHIMVVSDRKSETGTPLILHNIGRGAQEEDRLFEFELTGHYRIQNPDPAARDAASR